MTMLLLLKSTGDLFATVVPVEGYTNTHGHFVAPHHATRMRRWVARPKTKPAPAVELGDEWLIGRSGKPCLWCGGEEQVEVAEAWGHDFMLACCCETRQQQAVEDIADNPEYGRQLLREAGIETRRVVATDGGYGRLQLDFEPEIAEVTREEAQEFVATWHRHNDPLPADQWRYGIWNGGTLLGVVVGGAPTARGYNAAFQAKDLCEVRRVCIRTDLPAELTWKACSLLYQQAAAEAEARGFRKVITYTRADENGMSLRYARWKPEETVADKGHRRPGPEQGDTIGKTRWSKRLNPSAEALALPAAPVVAERQARRERQLLLFKG